MVPYRKTIHKKISCTYNSALQPFHKVDHKKGGVGWPQLVNYEGVYPRGGFSVLVRGVADSERSEPKIFATPLWIFTTPLQGVGKFYRGVATFNPLTYKHRADIWLTYCYVSSSLDKLLQTQRCVLVRQTQCLTKILFGQGLQNVFSQNATLQFSIPLLFPRCYSIEFFFQCFFKFQNTPFWVLYHWKC